MTSNTRLFFEFALFTTGYFVVHRFTNDKEWWKKCQKARLSAQI